MTPSVPVSCETVRQELAEACAPGAAAELRAHLASCPACARLAQDVRTLELALRELPPVPLPAGFEANLRGRLAELPRERALRHGLTRPAFLRAGLAFASVLAVAVGLWLAQPRTAPVEMVQRELVSVEVEVEAVAATSGVAVEITLPEGLAVQSDDPRLASLRTLAWTTELAAGTNRFALVLRADAPGDQRVHVALTAEGRHAETDLAVRVRPEGEHARFAPWSRGVLAGASTVRLSLGGRS